jgi:hypothetical protein
MSERNSTLLEFLSLVLRKIFNKNKGPIFYFFIFVLMVSLITISYFVYSSYTYNKAIRIYDKKYAKYEALKDFWEQINQWKDVKDAYKKNENTLLGVFYAYNIVRFADNLLPIIDYYTATYENRLWNDRIDRQNTLKTIRDKLSITIGKGYTLFNIAFRNKDKNRQKEAKSKLINLINTVYLHIIDAMYVKFNDDFFRKRIEIAIKDLENIASRVEKTNLYRKLLLELFIAYDKVLKDKNKAYLFYKKYENVFLEEKSKGLRCFVMFSGAGYYADEGKYNKAVQLYKEATQCNNSAIKDWAWFHIGWLYDKLGKKSEAIKVYNRLITRSTNREIVRESKKNLFFLEGK